MTCKHEKKIGGWRSTSTQSLSSGRCNINAHCTENSKCVVLNGIVVSLHPATTDFSQTCHQYRHYLSTTWEPWRPPVWKLVGELWGCSSFLAQLWMIRRPSHRPATHVMTLLIPQLSLDCILRSWNRVLSIKVLQGPPGLSKSCNMLITSQSRSKKERKPNLGFYCHFYI